MLAFTNDLLEKKKRESLFIFLILANDLINTLPLCQFINYFIKTTYLPHCRILNRFNSYTTNLSFNILAAIIPMGHILDKISICDGLFCQFIEVTWQIACYPADQLIYFSRCMHFSNCFFYKQIINFSKFHRKYLVAHLCNTTLL